MSGATLEPVAVVGRGEDQSQATLRHEIEQWANSEALRSLVVDFGGELDNRPLRELLEYLDAFSEAWDYRSRAVNDGRAPERNQAVIVEFNADRSKLVHEAVEALGLVMPNGPRYAEYDHVLVNGALVRYSIWRVAYAGHLIRTGLRTSTVAALTAFRDMARNPGNPETDETALLAMHGLPPVENEAEMMEFLLRREFDLPELANALEPGAPGEKRRFAVREVRAADVQFSVVAAPSPAAATRARTGDTMRFWASEVVDLKPSDRVLSISSAIYGPFQHAAALQHLALPYGAFVDTVSIDFAVIPPEPVPYTFSASQYLQEVRSTIRAYRALELQLGA